VKVVVSIALNLPASSYDGKGETVDTTTIYGYLVRFWPGAGAGVHWATAGG
jgi:hypothetical protein